MIRFYGPNIETTGSIPESESVHCCRVLRMKEGDVIFVVDGKGKSFKCEITNAHPKHTGVTILESFTEQKSWPVRIDMAIAPTKNIDRIEWFLEKAVEIGVDSVTMLRCEHSERKYVNLDRLEKIMVSAMKQSLKAEMPELHDMMPINEYVKSVTTTARFMGYCDADYPRLRLVDQYKSGEDVSILIGPEGDFSPEEVRMAVSSGFVPVSFGDARLRTETAALYSLSAIHIINDLK